MRSYRFLLSHSRVIIRAFVLAGVTLLLTGNRVTSSQDKEIIHEMPTPVEIGVMTRKQREHSKLFKPYGGDRQLEELADTGKGEIEVLVASFTPFGAGSLSEEDSKIYPNIYLKNISGDADAVIIGTIKNKSSQITGDGTFVFTDYEVAVEEFLKPHQEASFASNDHITVTRIGGTIKLRGRTVRARDLSFEPFKGDGRYLLFLKYIPATDSYQAFRSGSFLLDKNQATRLATELLWPAMENGVELKAFLTEVRDAIMSAHNDEMNGVKRCCFRLY